MGQIFSHLLLSFHFLYFTLILVNKAMRIYASHHSPENTFLCAAFPKTTEMIWLHYKRFYFFFSLLPFLLSSSAKQLEIFIFKTLVQQIAIFLCTAFSMYSSSEWFRITLWQRESQHALMPASFSIISKRKTAGDPFFHLAQDPKSARSHFNIILWQYDKMDVNRTLTNMIRREMIEQYNIGQIVFTNVHFMDTKLPL